jgi:hypothetical protein
VLTSRWGKPLPGHIKAAEQAARYAAQLGPDAADAIYRIAHPGSVRSYWRARAQLTAPGYQDPEPSRLTLDENNIIFNTEHVWDKWKGIPAGRRFPVRCRDHASAITGRTRLHRGGRPGTDRKCPGCSTRAAGGC